MWERDKDWLPPVCTWTGGLAHSLGMCLGMYRESNLRPFGVQDDAPTSWATQLGLFSGCSHAVFLALSSLASWHVWASLYEFCISDNSEIDYLHILIGCETEIMVVFKSLGCYFYFSLKNTEPLCDFLQPHPFLWDFLFPFTTHPCSPSPPILVFLLHIYLFHHKSGSPLMIVALGLTSVIFHTY